MELVQEFVVPRPVETAWAVLTDIEKIAPAMPGAQLQEVQGDTYRGIVKVKVGPILAHFAGEARFRSLDAAAHRAVLEARGKEAGGKGLAAAVITAELVSEGEQTRVKVLTDLTISGRLAQFGRGAMAEVSTKLLGQFAERLEATVLGSEAQPTVPAEPVTPEVAEPPVAATAVPAATQPAQVRRIDASAPEPVNLLSSAGPTILKRVVLPVLVVVALVAVLIVLTA